MFGRDPRELLAVFCGGALGSVARAALGVWVPVHSFPWATFTANLVAALLLGWSTTRLLERLPVSAYRRPFLGTGICGGLSTFSTLQVETIRLVRADELAIAAAYTVASVVLGYAAVHLGTALARGTRWRA
jgi:CrcB protein